MGSHTDTLAAATACVTAHSVRSVRRHHTTSERPFSRWLGHVSSAREGAQSGPHTRRQVSGRYTFRPVRVHTLAAATARVASHARPLRSHGVARRLRSAQPNPRPPAGGLRRGCRQEGEALRASAEFPCLAAWGAGSGCPELGSSWAGPCRCHGTDLACRCHGSPAPRMCLPSDLQQRPMSRACTRATRPLPPSPNQQ